MWQLCGPQQHSWECLQATDGFPLLSQPSHSLKKVYSLQTHWGSQPLHKPPHPTWEHVSEKNNWTYTPEALNGEQPEPGGRGRLLPVVSFQRFILCAVLLHLFVCSWTMPRLLPCSEAAIKLERVQVYIPAVMVKGRLRRGRAFRWYRNSRRRQLLFPVCNVLVPVQLTGCVVGLYGQRQ